MPTRVLSECRSCGAEILWVTTTNGKRMPVDREPSDRGNVDITDLSQARYLRQGQVELAREANLPLHLSHFATCPNAARHRRAQ